MAWKPWGTYFVSFSPHSETKETCAHDRQQITLYLISITLYYTFITHTHTPNNALTAILLKIRSINTSARIFNTHHAKEEKHDSTHACSMRQCYIDARSRRNIHPRRRRQFSFVFITRLLARSPSSRMFAQSARRRTSDRSSGANPPSQRNNSLARNCRVPRRRRRLLLSLSISTTVYTIMPMMKRLARGSIDRRFV